MVFHWSLSDNISPKVSRILLSILANRNNTVVWMVSVRPLISNLPGIIPSAQVTVGTAVTLMFHSFLSSLARSEYLPLFSFSLIFNLWSTGSPNPQYSRFSFFFFITRSGHLFLSQNPRESYAFHSLVEASKLSKLVDHRRGRAWGSLFNSYYTRCRRRYSSFSWISPLTLNPNHIMPSIKPGVIKYHFLTFWYDST